MAKFVIPINGYATGLAYDKPLPLTSGYMNNMRAKDTLEKQFRLGQRPGLDKAFSQQIGGATYPVCLLTSVTVID